MTDKKPAPITPEGRRAAEKIRTLFYSIAAANIVLFAVILWLGKARKEPEKPGAAQNSAAPKESGAPISAKQNNTP